MRMIFSVMFTVCLHTQVWAQTQQVTPDDTAGVKALVSRLADASNANDVKAFAAVFAEDADFTNVFGQRAQGRKEIEAFHAPYYVEPREPGLPSFVHAHLRVLESRVRFIRPDVASVDVRWEQTGAIAPDGKPWGRRIGLMNWVVARENGVWAIVAMHNMDLPETPPGRAR